MMIKKLEKKSLEYTIDLARIEGDGSFPCPKCGKQISPEDESEENYEILDTKIVNDELAELVISCADCRSVLKLTGFLQEIDS
jgi:hypothetical protein